jgi:WD40 repeat protein
VRHARFSPDGTTVATASDDGTIALWRVADGTRLWAKHDGGPVTALAFSPDGTSLASAWGEVVDVWSVDDGRKLFKLEPGNQIFAVAYSPDGETLATAELHGLAELWNAVTGEPIGTLVGHGPHSRVRDVVFSDDGTKLLTTGSDDDGRLWEVPTGRQLQLLRGQFGSLATGAFDPDGSWMVTAGPIAAALWLESSTDDPPVYYLRGPRDRLTDVAFSPDGKQVLAASADGTVRTYDCEVCGDLASLEALAEKRLRQPGLRPG